MDLNTILVIVFISGFVGLWGHRLCVGAQPDLGRAYPWRGIVSEMVLLAGVVLYIRWVGIELSMTLATLICGIIYLLEKQVWSKKRGKPVPYWIAQVVDFFPLLFCIWAIRSFAFQPYRVPSDSLQPTVLPGDFLLVNQFAYGVHFPVTHWTLWHRSGPKRGDIAVFYPPIDRSMFFVKRVVGLPRDRITYQGQKLIINGKTMVQEALAQRSVMMPGVADWPIAVEVKREKLVDKWHPIYLVVDPHQKITMDRTWHLPENHYFMMGDNRDFSGDSRLWGSVPKHDLVGKVAFIFLSIDPQAWQEHRWRDVIRWQRLLQWVE